MQRTQFPYGGQAVIEGVMMRGLRQATVAVRAPDGGIVYRDRLLNVTRRTLWARLPLLRGVQMLGDALLIGVWALSFSANASAGEDEQPLSSRELSGLIATSLAMAVGLFFVLPLLLASLVARLGLPPLLRELLEGVFRLGIFVGYLVLIRRSSDIQRVFAYHGAEHKTVNAYEAGAALTPAEVRRHSLIHPRCGTSFVLVVLLISIVVFSFLSGLPFWVRLLSRIVFVPLFAGIGYELLRLSARNYHRAWVRSLVAPTLLMQKLTTEEPDDAMLEVAILALRRVLVSDGIALEEHEIPVDQVLDPQPATV
ncbi:MAG TPA: DUF1385 domain-containing protein [Herpetosiphonaceae bacterium]|nr:DUF1385 domain-containing protein [Herpetosiphonaceae bacterium]